METTVWLAFLALGLFGLILAILNVITRFYTNKVLGNLEYGLAIITIGCFLVYLVSAMYLNHEIDCPV